MSENRRSAIFRAAALAASAFLLAGCPADSGPPKQATTVAPQASAPSTEHQASAQTAVEAPSTPGKRPSPGKPPSPAKPLQAPPPFDGWPKPEVALFLTGQQLGYIEPCGCTGLENQKGGLARRHTFLRQLKDEKGWPVVPLDVGSQVRRYGRQQEVKFQQTAGALRTLGYAAVMLGAEDLRLPAGELITGTNPDDKPSIFTAANVALVSRELQPTYQVVEAGGKKIGITGVLGDSFERKLQSGELVHEPALEGLKSHCRDLQAQNCDYYVLLAHATPEEAKQIAQEIPLFNLVVCSGGSGQPSTELEEIPDSKARLVRVSHKAMHVGVVGLFDDAKTTVRYQNIALDAQFKDSPEMLQVLADYQEELKAAGLEGLGLKPQPHPSGHKFVGSETCGECHTKATAKWSTTPHAHATDSLVRPPNTRADIPRQFDPECLSCHVTGWDPQKYTPFASGYLSLTETPKLQHNGCENCHGPGSAHVAAENGEGTDADRAKLRDAMKLPIAGGVAENKCRECHDEDNSPDFSHKGFAEYWKEVEHRGKD